MPVERMIFTLNSANQSCIPAAKLTWSIFIPNSDFDRRPSPLHTPTETVWLNSPQLP
jgi:hypothetical protein